MPVTYYKFPLSAEDCTPKLVSDLKNIGIVSQSISVWQTAMDWFMAHYWGPLLDVPVDESKPKKIWGVRNDSITSYIRFAKDKDGNWMKWKTVADGKATSGQNVVETFKQPGDTNPGAPVGMIDFLGKNAAVFFAEYGPQIPFIPQFEIVTKTKEENEKVNYFEGNGFVGLPLKLTWANGDFIPVFMPDGNPGFAKISDLIANLPKPGQAGGKYTEAEIGAAIRKNVAFLDDTNLGKYAKSLVQA